MSARASDSSSIVQVAGDYYVQFVSKAGSVDDRGTGSQGKPVGLLQAVSALDDPFALEVHRAIECDDGVRQVSVLPRYVPREHDAQLARKVQAAAAGHSTIAILVADSGAGKTRACWEAIRAPGALPEGWKLWHPIAPGRPQALLDGLAGIEPKTVLWLNETQHYLLTEGSDLGEQVAAGLRELLRDHSRGPVLILGTLWRSFNKILTAEGGALNGGHAQARALLGDAQIEVPEAFAGLALEEMRRAAATDSRLALAVERAEDGRITQFLAGAPELERRYRTSEAASKALLEAAMDVHRLGVGAAIPLALLENAALTYLAEAEWQQLGADWLESALADCSRPCLGALGPLTPLRPRPWQPAPSTRVYRLSDHLDQLGRREGSTRLPPAQLWEILRAHAELDDMNALGEAAQNRGLYRLAVDFYRAAGTAGSLVRAAGLLAQIGHVAESTEYARRAAKEGDADIAVRSARILYDAGQTEEAVDYARRAADSDDHKTLWAAAYLLEDAGHPQLAVEYARRAADIDRRSAHSAAELVARYGHLEDAISYACQAAQDGEGGAAGLLISLLKRAGRDEQALCTAVRFAEAGDGLALRTAIRLLTEAERTEEAITCAQRAAEAGAVLGWARATELLVRAGRIEEAVSWLAARAAAGDTYGSHSPPELLIDLGYTPLAIPFVKQAASMTTNPTALKWAALRLEKLGHTDEAVACAWRAATIVDEWELKWVIRLLERTGHAEDVISWLTTRADEGDGFALRRAVYAIQRTQGNEDAIRWLTARVDSGDTRAMGMAAELFARAGQPEPALTYVRRAAAAGNYDAVDDVLTLLADEGRIDDAIGLAHQAKRSGSQHTLACAARLFTTLGNIDDAIMCYRLAAEAGDVEAPFQIFSLLEHHGAAEEVSQLRRYGLEADGAVPAPWTAPRSNDADC